MARSIRMMALSSGVVGLAACSATPSPHGPMPGTDVACLLAATQRDGDGFDHALQTCSAAKPDLTGNIRLQRMALAAHVPFTIRPIADAELKGTDQVTGTGSLIPYRNTGQPYGFSVPAPVDSVGIP